MLRELGLAVFITVITMSQSSADTAFAINMENYRCMPVPGDGKIGTAFKEINDDHDEECTIEEVRQEVYMIECPKKQYVFTENYKACAEAALIMKTTKHRKDLEED